MLEIRVYMNSSVEDVLNFKTCCGPRAFDQNLEIHVSNKGPDPVVIPSYFDLEGNTGSYRVRTLMPQGDQTIPPGGLIAFYCMMDEKRWTESTGIVFYDIHGNRYPVGINTTGGRSI